MDREQLELNSLTLPAPPQNDAASQEHEGNRLARRREILGDEAFEKEQAAEPAEIGADPEEGAARYAASLEYKDRVLEKTEEIMDSTSTERRVPETTENDADSGRSPDASDESV